MAASALSALTTPSILSAGRESESGWNQVLSEISDEPGARPFERAHLIHAEAAPVRCGAHSIHTEAARRSRASRIPHPTTSGIRWERSPVAIGSPHSRVPDCDKFFFGKTLQLLFTLCAIICFRHPGLRT